MGNPTLSKIEIVRKFRLVALALTNPAKFNKEEKKDDELRAALPQARSLSNVEKVRLALFISLVIVALSGILGILLSIALRKVFGTPCAGVIASLQSAGALVLLFATIAVRGNEIATWDGITLSERVNRWIFESLYFIGTTMLVMSVSW